MKTCFKCKRQLDFSCYNKSSGRKDGLNPYCKDCCKQYRTDNKEKILAKKAETYRKDIDLSRKKSRERYHSNPEKYLKHQRDFYSTLNGRARKILIKCKERARKDNIPFDLTVEDIIIPEKCPYLGITLTHSLGEGQLLSNSSIDRVDPSKGYVKGNVEIISRLANTMKSCATKDQLLTFARYVIGRYSA